jgi:sugar phosphate isomerase/epimerase
MQNFMYNQVCRLLFHIQPQNLHRKNPMPNSSTRVPVCVATGSFWPEKTLQSINLLRRLRIHDMHLTLQAEDMRLLFDRSFDIPVLVSLTEWVEKDQIGIHSIHAPNPDTGNGYSLRSRLDYLAQTLDIAYTLHARVIDLHPFHLFTTHEAAEAYLRGEQRLDQVLLPGFRDLLDQARDWGIVLSLENIKMWEDDERDFFISVENLRLISADLAHEAFGVTLDVVHAQCTGSLYRILTDLRDHIAHMHIADFEPPFERLPVGEGSIEWQEVIPLIDRLSRLRCLTIELARATTNDVSNSVQTLNDLLTDHSD